MFFIHLNEENKPTPINFPIYKRFTLNQVIKNESVLNFIQDSLLKPPYKTADLQIKWAPLHPAILGLTTEVTDGIYFIQLNRGLTLEQTQRILMHELIHVYQFHYKLLEDLPNGSVKWMGEFYSWNLAWKDRPWEIHAEAWSNRLFVPDQP